MADAEHLAALREGVAAWREWRAARPDVVPDLAGAPLVGVDLRGAALAGANLARAELRGANLVGAQLQGADLGDADLSACYLGSASLADATLTRARLVGADLNKTDLSRADLSETNLFNANLGDAVGLRVQQLAGADLSNATLPPPIAFDGLQTVSEISRHARTNFLTLLAAALFCWLATSTTTDLALVTNASSLQLPILNVDVPVGSFYWAVPPLLLAVYLYLHFYLVRLWRELAALPAIFEDGRRLDQKAFPWLLSGLATANVRRLHERRLPLSGLENIVSFVLAWCIVPLTLGVLWLRYLPRHEWVGTAIHLVVLTAAIWAAIHFFVTMRRAFRRTARGRPAETEAVRRWRPWQVLRGAPARGGFWALLIGGVLFWLSWGVFHAPADPDRPAWLAALDGSGWDYEPFRTLGYHPVIELPFARLSTVDEGAAAPERAQPGDAGQARPAWDAPVTGIVLRGRSLRGARLTGAYLIDSDLAGADLSGAALDDADLRWTDLSGATLDQARLGGARLDGANLKEARGRRTFFAGASLNGAVLFNAHLETANFSRASLAGATLLGARLDRAILFDADLSRSNLGDASLAGAALVDANLSAAVIGNADLRGTEGLTCAQLQSAVNWRRAYRDPALACGAAIPTPP